MALKQLGFLLVAAPIALGTIMWVERLRVLRPFKRAWMRQLAEAGAREYEDRMALARDPLVNGYLNPLLLELWSEPMEDPKGSLAKALRDWVRAAEDVLGQVKNSLDAFSPPERYSQSRRDFEAYLPEILNAVSRPVYEPLGPLDPKSVGNSSFWGTRLDIALCYYAQSLFLEGAQEKAAELLHLLLGWAAERNHCVGMLARMGTLGLQSRLLDVLFKGVSVQSQGNERLAEALHRAAPDSKALGRAVGLDLAESLARWETVKPVGVIRNTIADFVGASYLFVFYSLDSLAVQTRPDGNEELSVLEPTVPSNEYSQLRTYERATELERAALWVVSSFFKVRAQHEQTGTLPDTLPSEYVAAGLVYSTDGATFRVAMPVPKTRAHCRTHIRLLDTGYGPWVRYRLGHLFIAWDMDTNSLVPLEE